MEKQHQYFLIQSQAVTLSYICDVPMGMFFAHE